MAKTIMIVDDEEDIRTTVRTILEKAKGKADAIIHEAESYKTEIVEAARSDARVIADLLKKFPNDAEGLNIYLRHYHQEILIY